MSDEEGKPAEPSGPSFLDQLKEKLDPSHLGGIEWSKDKVIYLAGMTCFSGLTLFVFAALVAPLWEWFTLNLNHRFAMFIGFTGCLIVLIGVPVKLGKFVNDKKDIADIKGLPTWITMTAVWNVILLILMQLICTGGLLGLLHDRGSWLPAEMFGPKSFITRIFHNTLDMKGVIGFNRPIRVDAGTLGEVVNICTTGTTDQLEEFIDDNPGLLRYAEKEDLNACFKAVLRSKKPDMMAVLAKHLELDQVDGKGNGLLHAAADSRDGPILRVLADAGCDVKAKNNDGNTPLHISVQTTGFLLGMDYLLFKGADINAVNGKGQTTLHSAIESGNPDQVQLLLARGADPNIKDAEGLTPTAFNEKILKETMTARRLTSEDQVPGRKIIRHYLEHVEEIKNNQAAPEWKALQSSKGTMWFYDPSSWNWKGDDLELNFELREGDKVLKEQKARLTPSGGTYDLHYGSKSKELSKLTDGAKGELNGFIATLPKENVPRTDPRWTADPKFDWDAAFKTK